MKPKREYTPYTGTIHGQRILESWYGKANATQTKTWWYKVECRCEDKIVLLACHSTVTRALQGKAMICCVPCKRQLKSVRNKERYHEPKRRGRPPVGDKPMTRVERANRHADKVKALKAAAKKKKEKPKFDQDTMTILKELAKKPSLMRRVMERARPYIAAALEAGLKPQTAQILTDALAMEQRGERDEGWTRENRADGLQICQYPVYQTPAITFDAR